jgi:hypothetical protein
MGKVLSIISQLIIAMTMHSADSLDKMKQSVPRLRADLEDPLKFKDIYQFCFNFARQEGQKSLSTLSDMLNT